MTDAYNNTVTESRTYNLDNTLAGITDNKSIGNLSYTWDANKNKTAETISGTMSNYGFSIPTGGYDDEDRLVSFSRTAGLTQAWSLSLVGDWNSVTTNGTAQARTHGPSHELLAGAGQNVTTDVKGNITLIPAALRPGGVALAMTWDFDNRLNSAVTGSTTVSHKYDALGRRVARTEGSATTIYAQSGQQTLCDYVAGAVPTASTYRYLFASYIDEPVLRITTTGTVATYLHRNQQYSITALTNSSGTILERYAYTAYGVPTITNAAGTVLTSTAQNNRFLYTGREWDGPISLYHYRARMYDASLGRFCSRDPIGYLTPPNLYVNAFGLDEMDPSGYRPCTAMEQASLIPKCPNICSRGNQTYTGGLYSCEASGFLSTFIVYECNCETSKGCRTSYFKPLWRQMHKYCDSIGGCYGEPKGSSKWECSNYRQKEIKWLACAKKREVLQRCFSPSDSQWPGHVKAIQQAIDASKNCGTKCAACWGNYQSQNPGPIW